MKQNHCRLIVIDGLDGSGKATQSRLLAERLAAEGLRTRTVSFPDYESDSSALVKMYLGGKLGGSPDDVNAYAASSFYAVDRVASFLNTWGRDYAEYDYLIADRYTTSNIIHQMAKVEESERDSYIDWLFDYEYNRLALPAPDLVLFLDVDPAISQKLIEGRYHGDKSKKDIHESDFAYLMRCRSSAAYAIEHLGWERIDCTQDGEMRTVESISDQIYTLIKERFHA